MTLLILLAPFIAVGMINTDKASVIGNISSLSLYLTILVTLCICLHLDQNKFPYLNCSFKSILRPCKNKQAKGIIRIISKHYCLIVLVCLFTLGLVMAASVKTNALLFGNIVLAVVILGCIVSCVFHGCCKVYLDTLNTIRAIVNSIILAWVYPTTDSFYFL